MSVLNLKINKTGVNLTKEKNQISLKMPSSGRNGKSAYEIALANGFTGTEAEWLTTLGNEGENAIVTFDPLAYYILSKN